MTTHLPRQTVAMSWDPEAWKVPLPDTCEPISGLYTRVGFRVTMVRGEMTIHIMLRVEYGLVRDNDEDFKPSCCVAS